MNAKTRGVAGLLAIFGACADNLDGIDLDHEVCPLSGEGTLRIELEGELPESVHLQLLDEAGDVYGEYDVSESFTVRDLPGARYRLRADRTLPDGAEGPAYQPTISEQDEQVCVIDGGTRSVTVRYEREPE